MTDRFIPSSPRAVVFFVKKPQKGLVKTRIAADIGEEKALAIYRLLLQNLDRVIDQFREGDVWFAVTPENAFESIRPFFSTKILIRSMAQQGEDLGQRMGHTFCKLFALGYKEVVLAGSDIPELECGHLESAFAVLESAGAVLGPSIDGGYYLIGFSANAFDSRVFNHVPWSTSLVTELTRKNLNNLEISFQELTPLRDVDVVGDLVSIIQSGKKHFLSVEFQKILES
jgi:rSAM/selenodomain-associated transferase 1